MLICISHVAKSDPADPRSRIVELGAMDGSTVLWRCSLAEIIARIRAGVRYFVIVDGLPVAVEVAPGTLLADASLKTAADKCDQAVLRTLPALPVVKTYR